MEVLKINKDMLSVQLGEEAKNHNKMFISNGSDYNCYECEKPSLCFSITTKNTEDSQLSNCWLCLKCLSEIQDLFLESNFNINKEWPEDLSLPGDLEPKKVKEK